MLGLDTNVLVRYIMQDDARQAELATRMIESRSTRSPGFVSLIVVVELSWVLSSAYKLERVQVADAIEGLLRAKEIVVEATGIVSNALRVFRNGHVDLADCLIVRVAHASGCEQSVTFDRRAAKHAGMVLLT